MAEVLPRLGHALLLRQRLVAIELQRGAPQSALAIVEASLTKTPGNVQWLLQMSEVLGLLDRRHEARECLKEALSTVNAGRSRRPTALRLVQRAEVRLAQGDRDGAIADVQTALKKGPSFPKARALATQLGLPGSS